MTNENDYFFDKNFGIAINFFLITNTKFFEDFKMIIMIILKKIL